MEKYKIYKKISSQKGAISIFTVLAMIFFLMFVLGAFTFATRRNQTQVQSLSDLKSVYKQDANAIYDDLAGTIETGQVPIYSEKDFSQIRNGMIRTINGKNYLFSDGASYILKNDIKIDLEKTLNSSYSPKDYTLYDGKKADNGSDSVSGNGFDVYYMYDSDKDGEQEKYKLIAYSKQESNIPSNSTRNETNFNIIGDGNDIGSLETLNINAYKYDDKYNFLMVKCEYVGAVLETNISPVLIMENDTITGLNEIIDAYVASETIGDSDFYTSTEQYYLLVRAQEDAVEVYIEGTLERDIESEDDEEEIAVAIVNNTKKSINYTVLPTSDAFEIEGGINNKIELAAGKQVRVILTLKTKDNFYYTNVSDEAKINVNIEREYINGNGTNEEEFIMTLNTFNYKLKELILREKIKNNPDFTENITTVEKSGIYTIADNSGTSYYYRGVVENNYVKFANKEWRIVRINGDGSYRLVLSGYTGDKVLFGDTDSNFANSIVKIKLQEWYSNNLSSYDNYIDKNATFWSDRTYEANTRLSNLTNTDSKTYPTLKTANTSDIFSVAKGNLTKPIGLLTADELVLAGATTDGYPNNGGEKGNYDFYLHCSQDTNEKGVGVGYWTMTPVHAGALVVSKPQAGVYVETYTKTARNLRPVINLKSTVMVKGNGTKDDPYVIKAEK